VNGRARRSYRAAGAVLAIAAAGCNTMPRDAYRTGESALAAGELAAALHAFDSVPVSDLRYPEARLHAAAIERRLRRHAEQVLLGLSRRNEWRDGEAIEAFRGALEAWPDSIETMQLIAATEQRRHLLAFLQGHRDDAPPVPSAAPPVHAAGAPSPLPEAPAPPTADTGPDTTAATEPPIAAPPAVAEPAPSAPRATPVNDRIGTELAQIEARAVAGDLDQVLADLFALQRTAPVDTRVTARLARLLQQRGLLHYGQGQVAQAIADLQRATELDPTLQSARVLFELAAKELAVPPR